MGTFWLQRQFLDPGSRCLCFSVPEVRTKKECRKGAPKGLQTGLLFRPRAQLEGLQNNKKTTYVFVEILAGLSSSCSYYKTKWYYKGRRTKGRGPRSPPASHPPSRCGTPPTPPCPSRGPWARALAPRPEPLGPSPALRARPSVTMYWPCSDLFPGICILHVSR